MANLATRDFFRQESVQSKFRELLNDRAPQFITTVLQIVNSNNLLANADPTSIYNAAATAAVLNLPINPSLGFAYIIPFGEKQKSGEYVQKAQFQIGYKGFIQLAQRSGQFKTINCVPVFEGDEDSDVNERLTAIVSKRPKSNVLVGYAAYFKLLNGFEKTLFMDLEALKCHGKKYSQTYKKNFGLWEDNFEAMAQKTVIKLLLSKYAPLSIEMQRAVITDQAVVNDTETLDVTYVDNTEEAKPDPKSKEQIEEERLIDLINSSNSIPDLQKAIKGATMTGKANDAFNLKMNELDAKAN